MDIFMNLIKLESRDYKNRFFEIGTMAPRLNWARLSILSSDKFRLTWKLIKKTEIKNETRKNVKTRKKPRENAKKIEKII